LELATYMPVPPQRSREFWTQWKISHIRQLSQTGKATEEYLLPESERTRRVLDRLYLRLAKTSAATTRNVSTVVPFAHGSLDLSSPIYLGDMSFGALSGIPNIAIARAADVNGVLAGTGEGGIQRDVGECKRITVQWASARFGVDISTLTNSQAVVIKIGQGAKPGIGGHLPGVKVTRPISETRRIPMGKDAISPAPHHDIYSIEDLGQRILALKEATKKPVFVKVGATNYIPYIASGVARMGGDGIIIDGAGAGTGAAPSVVKGNVGVPIELAVASVDKMLRREGLREGFTVVAAGRVSCPEDSLKLMALGADVTSLGTAALLALGCLMVHKCHLGYCPAVLTNKITENQAKVLSLSQSVTWLSNLVSGWTEELKVLLDLIGLSSVRELRGRRDLLTQDGTLYPETLEILGFPESPSQASNSSSFSEGSIWPSNRVNMLREMAGTIGKSPAEAEISSMGSVGPPFVDKPARLTDLLISDGAQVTRPSIDPYREEIEIFAYLHSGRLRLAAPFFFSHLPASIPREARKIFARTAVSMGLLYDLEKDDPGFSRYAERTISTRFANGLRWIDTDALVGGELEQPPAIPDPIIFLRVSCSEESLKWVEANFKTYAHLLSGIIVDEDHPLSNLPLESGVSALDRLVKGFNKRSDLAILAESNSVRGAEDIFKIVALGADAVGLGKAALIAIGFEEGDKEIVFDSEKATGRLENFVVALEKEIKLLAGAAGVSSVSSSLVGNRELLRSVDMDPKIRAGLGVKPAGWG
jgi:glutamate synthase domain-containing protein 2